MWKDCLSLTFALIANIGCHFDSSGRGKCLIKPTICNFWLFTLSFLCCPVTFVGKIIFTTFPLPFQLALLKKKIIEPCIFQDHSRLKKLKNFAKPLSLSNIAPHLLSRMFKVDCCPISMPQIITSTLLQTPQKPTLFSCFVNSFAIDTRCGKKSQLTLLVSK